MRLHFHFKDHSRGNKTLNNDDNVCRAYFCMMLVEGVLVEGEGALVGVEVANMEVNKMAHIVAAMP